MNGIHEAVGSIPISSTIIFKHLVYVFKRFWTNRALK
jgi:hypothetical protein